jgi:hypothetical protein
MHGSRGAGSGEVTVRYHPSPVRTWTRMIAHPHGIIGTFASMVRKLNAMAPVPFEIWREDGVLRVLLGSFTCIGVNEAKEMVRVLGAVDASGLEPVVIDTEEHVRFTADARVFLSRCCPDVGRPVAFVGFDGTDRLVAERFAHFLQPAFPFKAFNYLGDALDWSMGWQHAPRMRVVHAC